MNKLKTFAQVILAITISVLLVLLVGTCFAFLDKLASPLENLNATVNSDHSVTVQWDRDIRETKTDYSGWDWHYVVHWDTDNKYHDRYPNSYIGEETQFAETKADHFTTPKLSPGKWYILVQYRAWRTGTHYMHQQDEAESKWTEVIVQIPAY
jgi:hypothetical protein